MKSDQWIIKIDGRTYSVDRTFDGSPAVFYWEGPDRLVRTHISGRPPDDSGQVVILAHLTTDTEKGEPLE